MKPSKPCCSSTHTRRRWSDLCSTNRDRAAALLMRSFSKVFINVRMCGVSVTNARIYAYSVYARWTLQTCILQRRAFQMAVVSLVAYAFAICGGFCEISKSIRSQELRRCGIHRCSVEQCSRIRAVDRAENSYIDSQAHSE